VYPTGENAHNHFLQVAVELGLRRGAIRDPGVRAFDPRPARASPPALRSTPAGIAGAALGFLITMWSGHPLLTPAIAFAVRIVLGLCEAESKRRLGTDFTVWRAGPIAAVAIAAIAIRCLSAAPSGA
jgi:hypothetical protein